MVARRLEPVSLMLVAWLGCSSTTTAAADQAAPPVQEKADKPHTPPPPTAMPDPEDAPVAELPVCCGSQEDVKRLDGARVRLRGLYHRTSVSKRRVRRGEPEPPPNLDEPGTVAINTEGSGVMLEIYYRSEGIRPAEESTQFHGQQVEVVGVLHQATPTQFHEGHEMQTMINPYIGAIESIELLESG